MSDAARVLLEARGIRKVFGTPSRSLEVLSGVDLTLARGEMTALLGISGVGKSTLIQILGTLDHPTSGSVHLDGVDLFKLSQPEQARLRNRRVGFVYQSHRLLQEFSAMENVMMPLLIGRVPRERAAALSEEILTEVGLKERLTHRPGQLSGGEQQRVAIARALVTAPDLLLADEPTGNLDRQTAQGVFDMLREMNRRRGLTSLLVTHNPELAAGMDRSVHLVDGRLEAAAP